MCYNAQTGQRILQWSNMSLVLKVKSHILDIELDIGSGFISLCLYQTVGQKGFEVT